MTIRWGIVGCGDVCEVKSGPALQKAAGSELVAVMRRDGEKARDFAARHGVRHAFDDADVLIEHPEVDAVYVATPPGSHEELAVRVARAGKPCYVEKPMARSAAECERMNAAFDQAGVPLYVAYYRRALPRFVRVKQLLDDGRIGRLTGVSCRLFTPSPSDPTQWRLQPEHSGGGLFMDLGSHLLDLLDHLLGPLTLVHAAAANRSGLTTAEDSVAITVSFGDGVPGQMLFDFAATSKRPGVDEMVFSGDRGQLGCSCFGNEPVRLMTAEGVEQFDETNPPHVHGPLVQRMVDALNGKGGEMPSTGASATRTARLMDAVLTDYYGGRVDVFWERLGRA